MHSTPKTKFDQQTVDTAIENLKAMPPAPRETKQLTIGQAIKEMRPTIALLIRRGYSRERVVALLKEQGIECSPATFRSLYRAPKRRRAESTPPATKPATNAGSFGERQGAPSATPSGSVTPVSTSTPVVGPNVIRSEGRGVALGSPSATAKAS